MVEKCLFGVAVKSAKCGNDTTIHLFRDLRKLD